MRVVVFVLLLALPSAADVSDLLRWQQVGDSGAYVSSGFHDWRTVSKYRRVAGLHAGYDIAMLPGAAVRTPWAGEVVAITPWYGRELGVTIRLQNGWEATFGHIETSLLVGQVLKRGDVVGSVVVDHVDVKMRTSDGRLVDFDAERRSLGPVVASAQPPTTPQLFPEEYDRYRELLTALTRLEKQVELGLAPAGKLVSKRKELESVKPLARLHAQRSSLEFQESYALSVVRERPSRELTDFILELE
jgi:hypothetical protein